MSNGRGPRGLFQLLPIPPTDYASFTDKFNPLSLATRYVQYYYGGNRSDMTNHMESEDKTLIINESEFIVVLKMLHETWALAVDYSPADQYPDEEDILNRGEVLLKKYGIEV